MSKRIENGSLGLEVTDFGPIIEAKVDLRPLTVFVGPSNTGKSYLAILIYALHRFFSDGQYPAYWRLGRRFPSFPHLGMRDLSDEAVDALWGFARSLAETSDIPITSSLPLPPPVADALRSVFARNADALVGEIGRCFGIGEIDGLIRRGRRSSATIVMRRRWPGVSELVAHGLTLAGKPEFKPTIPAEARIFIESEANDGLDEYLALISRFMDGERGDANERRYAVQELLTTLGQVTLPSAVAPLHLPAYYLPADRTGVMHAHSVVVSALIASAPTAGLRPAAQTPVLSGVLADFLDQLIGIGRRGPRRGARRRSERDLGTKIEAAILEGEVRIDRATETGYPRFGYRPAGWKDDLALANASSMVSELAPVVLYLRHMIEPGNVLIVEEPESHLHPAMQVALTRQLAALVNADVRVIVTTHSEWLLEELANIVRRSELSKATRGDDIALRPDQVGAWLFMPKQRPKGSVVKEIRLDDSGLYPSGYDEVASALHNEWADISSRIEADS